jgi:hypothetical protein
LATVTFLLAVICGLQLMWSALRAHLVNVIEVHGSFGSVYIVVWRFLRRRR